MAKKKPPDGCSCPACRIGSGAKCWKTLPGEASERTWSCKCGNYYCDGVNAPHHCEQLRKRRHGW